MGLLTLLILGLFPCPCSARKITLCSSWCLTKSPLLGDKDLEVGSFPPVSSEAAWEYFLSSKKNCSATLHTQAMASFVFHDDCKLLPLCLPKLTPTTLSVKYSQNVCKGQNLPNLPAPVMYLPFLTTCRIDLGWE